MKFVKVDPNRKNVHSVRSLVRCMLAVHTPGTILKAVATEVQNQEMKEQQAKRSARR